MKIKDEFITFLNDYNIVALSVAFVMGVASTSLVQSLVKDIFMPLFSLLLPSDSWREAAIAIGPASVRYGAFIAELINFLLLSFVVFIIIKKLIRFNKEPEN